LAIETPLKDYTRMKHLYKTLTIALLPVLAACSQATTAATPVDTSAAATAVKTTSAKIPKAQRAFAETPKDGQAIAIFAGGCFWCTESDFEKLPGVIRAISGYTGGAVNNPDYKQVSYTETGHYEAVKVIFDPEQVSYRQLVDGFWKTIDPTDDRGQFCDKGSSYRSAIFVTPEQRADAQASKAEIVKNKPFVAEIVTPILNATTFYKAEAVHQNYYKTNSLKYKSYRNGCRRDQRLEQLWGAK